jgi:hypothetical protein
MMILRAHKRDEIKDQEPHCYWAKPRDFFDHNAFLFYFDDLQAN